MKCCSRSTLGVIVGVLSLISYAVAIIGTVINLVQINLLLRSDEDLYNSEQTKSFLRTNNTIMSVVLVVCVALAVISGLLIAGIVQRRHRLMAPWLIVSAIGFVCSVVGLIFHLITAVIFGVYISNIVLSLVLSCVVIGIEYFIIYKIYRLYKDIRAKYQEETPQVVSGAQMVFANSYPNQQEYGNNGFRVVSEKY